MMTPQPPTTRATAVDEMTTAKRTAITTTRRWQLFKLGCSGLLIVTVLNNYIFYTRQAIGSIHPADLEQQTSVDDAKRTMAAFWFPSTTTTTLMVGSRSSTRHDLFRKTTKDYAVADHYSGANNDNNAVVVVVDARRKYRPEEEQETTNRLHRLVDIVVQESNSIIDDSRITRYNGQKQQQQQGTKWLWKPKKKNPRDDIDIDHHDFLVYGARSIHQNNNDNEISNSHDNNSNHIIRSWGCSLTQTPLIYIHIGKSGGGQVRARFAASSNNFEQLLQIAKKEQQQLLLLQQQNENVTKKDMAAAANWFRHANNRAYFLVHNDNQQDEQQQQQQQHGRHGITSLAAKESSSSSPPNSNHNRVYFCNSRHTNFRVHPIEMYEGTSACHATTPLGQAVACPERLERMMAYNDGCHGCGDASAQNCRVVYLGHNLLGNELHWLPSKYLVQWWLASPWGRNQQQQQRQRRPRDVHDDPMHSYLNTLMPDNRAWCSSYNLSRPMRQQQQDDVYLKCSIPLAHAVDETATRALLDEKHHQQQHQQQQQQQQQQQVRTTTMTQAKYKKLLHHHADIMMDWSPVYASLPVLRTTILREPFSWLVSRFFWHGNDNFFSCNDIDAAGDQQHNDAAADDDDDDDDAVECQIHQTHGRGWANRYALLYIFYLCGEDCAARYELSCSNNNINSNDAKQTRRLLLAQMEQQAANNLRQSFAVVGLLNETDTFYDMVASRVQYMANMVSSSDLLQDDQDRRHSTEGGKEQQRCKALYQSNVTFQNELMNRSPALAALNRLFYIGVQVNRFQIQELKQECGMGMAPS